MVFYNFVLRWTKIGVVCYISCLIGVFLLTFGCELWFCLVIVGDSGVGLIW